MMTYKEELESKGKYMSYVLRHGKEEYDAGLIDENGWMLVDDPRVLNGELVGVTKGNKLSAEHNKKLHQVHVNCIHINNGEKMKYINKEKLDEYLTNGWVIGELPKIYTEEKKKEISKKISEKIKGRVYITKNKKKKIK